VRRRDGKLRPRGIELACVSRVGGRVRRLQRVVSGKDREGIRRERGGWRGLLRMSMSEGVTYWVPATHWKFEIVGLGGMSACGLKSLSNDFCLQDG
jgi:hypothetical protein